MDKVTLALVGCGSMARAHREGLGKLWKAGLRGFEVTATCDVAEEKASQMAAQFEEIQGSRPKVYRNVEELLGKEKGLVAVDICVAHRDHHSVALPCFEAKKHVTIEKPLAITLRAGKLMLEAAKKAGTVFQVAENYRRAPEHRAVNWAIRQGRIGKPRMVYWIDAGERLGHWGWREEKFVAGGGWALDGGVHFADLMRYHVGEVGRMYAEVRAFCPFRRPEREKTAAPTIPVDLEDTTVAILEFENGALGQWTSTSAAPGQGFSRRVIYGEEGSVDFSDGLKTRSGEARTIKELVVEHQSAIGEEEMEQFFPKGVTDTVSTELWEFLEAVRGKGKVEIDGWEGFKSQAVSEALYESEALGRAVTLAEVEKLEAEEYQREINEALGL